eukprot:3939879-Rhodomonas_salina.1
MRRPPLLQRRLGRTSSLFDRGALLWRARGAGRLCACACRGVREACGRRAKLRGGRDRAGGGGRHAGVLRGSRGRWMSPPGSTSRAGRGLWWSGACGFGNRGARGGWWGGCPGGRSDVQRRELGAGGGTGGGA